jgi:hypothetical protein
VHHRRGFTRQEVLDMENAILTKLHFKLSVPTGHPFLKRFLFITNATKTMNYAANYYMERVLQEHEFLAFPPSIVAAAAVCLAINHHGIRENDCLLTVKKPGVVRISCILFDRSPIHAVYEWRSPLFCLALPALSAPGCCGCVSVAKMIRPKSEEVVTASRRELLAVKRS